MRNYASKKPSRRLLAMCGLVVAIAALCAGRATSASEKSSVPEVQNEATTTPPPVVTPPAAIVAEAARAQPDIERFAAPEEDEAVDPLSLAGLKALAEKDGLMPVFEKGGLIMVPLLLASILAFGTVIDRIFFLISVRRTRDRKAMHNFYEAVSKDQLDEAIRIGRESKFYVVRTLGYALEHREKSLANALTFAQEQEMKRFRRGIPILDTIITLAPLLGLLGTVTGMMGSFALIGGELSSPGAITGGIAEALIATSFGLGIAITSLIPFNFLNNKMESARIELDSAATQLELLMIPKEKKESRKPSSKTNPRLGFATGSRPLLPKARVEPKRETSKELVGAV